MNDTAPVENDPFRHALSAIEHALASLDRCSPEEKERLHRDLAELREMERKLTGGRVEIAVFGEISTGKSALINALVGQAVASVDVRGGWTREVWKVPWDGCGYVVPGLAGSMVVLVDTPGLNEVGGGERGNLAKTAASQADLVLFVTDSDLNETEYSALVALAAANKPIVLVFNKIDLYSPEDRDRLLDVLRDERLAEILQPENVVLAAADPRPIEYVIESTDGSVRSEMRKPPPQVGDLKARILQVLEKDGLALVALNAAMYAADKSDRIVALKVQMRGDRANATIWSYAGFKSLAVAINHVPVADVIGGSVVDAAMIVTLAHIYGLPMTWANARGLVSSIAQAAGWLALGELVTHAVCWTCKALTLGWATVLTAVPQGAAAGYGSYIVGQAARYYFEHGGSWGGESPKAVVGRILDQTDKQSVLDHLKDEIRKKLQLNPHAGRATG
jgi:GTP-binding protein Era